jgi:RNA polymerase sigma-70 factor (ECF subfamily)
MGFAASKPVQPGNGAAGPQVADEQLVERCLGGDQTAFEALVLRHQDRLYNLLVRLCGSRGEAEDLAQEAFLKAYRGLSSFRQGSQFYTWLFRIAVNTAYSRGRRLAGRMEREAGRLDAGGQDDREQNLVESMAGDPEDDPAVSLERRQLQERVRAGLERLDADHRAVILLRDMEGLDYERVAEVLGTTRAAVKSRLHRARQELARVLKDLRPEGGRKVEAV